MRSTRFGLRGVRNDVVRSLIIVGATAVVLYLVVVPMFFLLYGSVFDGRPGGRGEVTFGTYLDVVTDPDTYGLLANSAIYAVASSVLSVTFGVIIAVLLQRTDVGLKGFFLSLALVPLVLPTVLTTIGWILLLDTNIGLFNAIVSWIPGLESGIFNAYSFPAMIWIKALLDVPLVVIWLWPAFRSMDPSLEEAAGVCGASPFRAVMTITIPLVRPALLASFIVSVIASLEDVAVPLLVGLPARVDVFASEIYVAAARTPSDIHRASVYGVILLIITLLLLMLYRRLLGASERYVTVRGKGYRPALIRLRAWRIPMTAILASAMFVLFVLPLLMLVWISLMPFSQAFSFDAFGLITLDTYRRLPSTPGTVSGLFNSAWLGVVTAILVMALSLIIGWIVVRSRSKASRLLDLVSFAPIAIPGLVLAIALIWLYTSYPSSFRIYGTTTMLVIAYVTLFIPFGVRIAFAGFTQLHTDLEEASSISGSTWWQTMRQITLPILAPTLLVGAVYIFLRTFRELPASLMLHPIGVELYSVTAFELWQAGMSKETAAYGVVAVVLMGTTIVVLEWAGRRRRVSLTEIA